MGNAIPSNQMRKIYYFEVYDSDDETSTIVEGTNMESIHKEHVRHRKAGDNISQIKYREENINLRT